MIIHINCTLGSQLALGSSHVGCPEWFILYRVSLCIPSHIFVVARLADRIHNTPGLTFKHIRVLAQLRVVSMILMFFSHWYSAWYCRKSLFLCLFYFRDSHDGSWFMEMEQHPSVLGVYQWLNDYGKIRRAPAAVRPSVCPFWNIMI